MKNSENNRADTTLDEIVAEGRRSLVLFDATAIKAVKALMAAKNGRPYIRCQVRGKEIQAKPEEIIRQLWIHRLTTHYQYPVSRMQVEYPITFGRDTSKRADIIVMDADRPTVPYAIIEVKRDKATGNYTLKQPTTFSPSPMPNRKSGTGFCG
jgi:type I restriction enzyme M protein